MKQKDKIDRSTFQARFVRDTRAIRQAIDPLSFQAAQPLADIFDDSFDDEDDFQGAQDGFFDDSDDFGSIDQLGIGVIVCVPRALNQCH